MSIQEKVREGIAKRKLELVVRLETRLIHSLPPKVQKQLGHEPYTWETIPEYLKVFWLDEADKEMKELDSQGVVIKVETEPDKIRRGEDGGQKYYGDMPSEMYDDGWRLTEPLIKE